MHNVELNQSEEKVSKGIPARTLSYPKQKLPKYLKELINVTNTLEAASDAMHKLTSSMISEELKKY